jgi:hypothetical protein
MTDEQASCCGQGGKSWAKAGEPLKPGCQLCPNSPGYWRRDGRRLPTVQESYRSAPDIGADG